MAPSVPKSPALMPNEYTSVKTPEGAHHQFNHEAKSGVSQWSQKYTYLGRIVQFLVFAAIGVYVYGQLLYFHPLYQANIRANIGAWWGVPKTPATGGGGSSQAKGNPEMIRPTFYTIFGVVPIIVIVLLVEYLRHFNLRRMSSAYLLKVAMVLRRKPAAFGKVSYWSYGEWLFMGFLIIGNILAFYWGIDRRVTRLKDAAKKKNKDVTFEQYLEAIAITMGFNCIYNMAYLFLPATRNCAWMEFFNISYANGVKYHRWLGVVTVLTAWLHCVGYYWAWIREGIWMEEALPCFDCPLDSKKGFHVWFNVFGEIALLLFLIIGLTSIPIIRRKLYNVFYYSHQLFGLAVVFAVLHWGPILWWILPTFLLYVYSRAISNSNSFTPVEIQELSAISDDLVKVVIKRSPHRDGHFKVGNFVYLNVPSISSLQWHAFTISSSPRTSHTTLTILLKSLGDWTQDLVTYANECKQNNVLPTVYMDGYYGASLEMYDEYSTVCLVGGGIGATPMFAILEDMVAKLSAGHESLVQRVVFIFTFRELALLEEVHPILLKLRELDPQERFHKLHFYLTRVPTQDVLTKPIDYERLNGKHIHATKYDKPQTSPRPFYEPLRSRSLKVIAMLSMFFIALVSVMVLTYGGGKIETASAKLWPLQQFTEVFMLFIAAVAVYGFVVFERARKRRSQFAGDSKNVELLAYQNTTPAFLPDSDVHTYQDLVSHYNVSVGQRPEIKALMTETLAFHQSPQDDIVGKPVIGVFISGPDALKRNTEYAVAELGAAHFDLHEEEFEL